MDPKYVISMDDFSMNHVEFERGYRYPIKRVLKDYFIVGVDGGETPIMKKDPDFLTVYSRA
jgi:hypothetical protein